MARWRGGAAHRCQVGYHAVQINGALRRQFGRKESRKAALNFRISALSPSCHTYALTSPCGYGGARRTETEETRANRSGHGGSRVRDLARVGALQQARECCGGWGFENQSHTPDLRRDIACSRPRRRQHDAPQLVEGACPRVPERALEHARCRYRHLRQLRDGVAERNPIAHAVRRRALSRRVQWRRRRVPRHA